MARKSFAIFGLPPFPILAEHLVKDEGFEADAKSIIGIDDAIFEELVVRLTKVGPFLDRSGVSDVVHDVLDDAELSDTVSHFVSRLNDLLRGAGDSLEDALGTLQQAIRAELKAIGEAERTELGTRIERLVSAPLGFACQYKAEQLVEATGLDLDDFQIICDMRPVFDEKRSRIEGVVPISTMTIDTISTDGTPSRIQVRLNERQVHDILRKAECAKGKIGVIKKTLQEKSIVAPTTSATIDLEVDE